MIPCWVGFWSLLFLPATPFSLYVSDPWVFERTRRPSKALNLHALVTSTLFTEQHNKNRDTVQCCILGAEFKGHSKEKRTQTLIVLLFKTHFFVVPKIVRGPGPP